VGTLSVAQQLDRLANGARATWFPTVNNEIKIQLQDAESSKPVLLFSDVPMKGALGWVGDLTIESDWDRVINTLSVTNHKTKQKTYLDEDWTADDTQRTFTDKESLAKYGPQKDEVDWNIYDDGLAVMRRVKQVFARFASFGHVITGMRINAQIDPKRLFSLEIHDRILIQLEGWIQDCRILKVKPSLTGDRWYIDLELDPIDVYMASETFDEFDIAETATTFDDFDAKYAGVETFDSFDKHWRA
jgi:hypothetical protein